MSTVAVRRRGLTGNDAVAFAWRQINPDVVAAYPITPSTQIVERFSQYVAEGQVTTQYVPVESEHSALSACVGASASGARVMTATSSQGLALMHEVLHIAGGLRLPIVMAVATRALSAPINIHGDHSDVMDARDAGWIQLFAGDVQEAYDLTILAVRIAERARLPVMVCLDGFTLSHSLEPVETYDEEAVRAFVGCGRPIEGTLLDTGHPLTFGPLALPDAYMDFRVALADGLRRALPVIYDETLAFHAQFKRSLPVFLEAVGMEDAESAVLMMGAYAGVVGEAVERWRRRGDRVGLTRLVTFRPFPQVALARLFRDVRHVAVLERADTASTMGGPLGIELRATLHAHHIGAEVTDVVFGLGGRELREEDLDVVAGILKGPAAAGPRYLGIEENTAWC